jgi:hypothetical protein
MLRATAAAMAGGALAAAAGCGRGSAQQATPPPAWPPSLPAGTWTPSTTDETFLDELERQGCRYFWEQASPANGQILDHAANNLGGTMDTSTTESSIAATGFGLTALCIADSRGYLPNVTHAQIVARVQTTLNFHLNNMQSESGFFYHFNDVNTGQPLSGSEVSSIDTAWLLCGVLAARAYFNDSLITSLATRLYERVAWPWMLNGGQTFAQAWYPASAANPGFSAARYDTYCELMALYLLAIGSPTNPIAASFWNNFARPVLTYEGYSYISSNSDPLFTHQYAHAWFDFRSMSDAYANYFTNSIYATQAHETFCLSYPDWYTEDYWGITSSDYAGGYTAWGGPPAQGPIDGTVVPCAAAGSLAFLPNECLEVLEALQTNWGSSPAWGRYGFVDAFNAKVSPYWYNANCLGIDLGISVLMAENLRTGLVWETFMSNAECAQAMHLAGFTSQS